MIIAGYENEPFAHMIPIDQLVSDICSTVPGASPGGISLPHNPSIEGTVAAKKQWPPCEQEGNAQNVGHDEEVDNESQGSVSQKSTDEASAAQNPQHYRLRRLSVLAGIGAVIVLAMIVKLGAPEWHNSRNAKVGHLQQGIATEHLGGRGSRTAASTSPSANYASPSPIPNGSMVTLNQLLASRLLLPASLSLDPKNPHARPRRGGWLEFPDETHSMASSQQISPGSRVRRLVLGGAQSFSNISNHTFDSYLYYGPVSGSSIMFDLRPWKGPFDTYDCPAICGNRYAIYFNTTSTSPSVIATWLFPLAILLSLPFETVPGKTLRSTVSAIISWFGSPQTALMALFFNSYTLIQAQLLVDNEEPNQAWTDALYVLSCFNQLELNTKEEQRRDMLTTMFYGLFRPLGAMDAEECPDMELTRQLLYSLASQMRVLRRRGIIPIIFSLGGFFLAFGLSLSLAFSDLGDEHQPATMLSLGLLFAWVPILVVFSVVHRDPISSERSAYVPLITFPELDPFRVR